MKRKKSAVLDHSMGVTKMRDIIIVSSLEYTLNKKGVIEKNDQLYI